MPKCEFRKGSVCKSPYKHGRHQPGAYCSPDAGFEEECPLLLKSENVKLNFKIQELQKERR